jgi:hypothetical protein
LRWTFQKLAGSGVPQDWDLNTIALQAPENMNEADSMLRTTPLCGIGFRPADVAQFTNAN